MPEIHTRLLHGYVDYTIDNSSMKSACRRLKDIKPALNTEHVAKEHELLPARILQKIELIQKGSKKLVTIHELAKQLDCSYSAIQQI